MSGEIPTLHDVLSELSETTGTVVIDTPLDSKGNPIIDDRIIFDADGTEFDRKYFAQSRNMPRASIIIDGDNVTYIPSS